MHILQGDDMPYGSSHKTRIACAYVFYCSWQFSTFWVVNQLGARFNNDTAGMISVRVQHAGLRSNRYREFDLEFTVDEPRYQ